jgi:hypothetical protein
MGVQLICHPMGMSRAGLLFGLAVAVGIAVLYVNPFHGQKPPVPAARKQTPQNQCAVDATLDYNKANLALWEQRKQSPAAMLSVETEIMQRRLQEQYCQRFAGCLVDANDQSNSMMYGTVFSSCLRDEVLEEYDAVPREDHDDSVER